MTERVRKLGPNPLKLQVEGQKLMVEESEDEVEFRGRRQKEG